MGRPDRFGIGFVLPAGMLRGYTVHDSVSCFENFVQKARPSIGDATMSQGGDSVQNRFLDVRPLEMDFHR
jgi:hypothetical protein